MLNEPLRCGELMKRIFDIFEARANGTLQEQDVTLSQMKMLACLDHAPDSSATLKELERYLDSSQATIAGIAVRLEKKGLIHSYIDAKDRRIKHVRLSEAGRTLCSSAKATVDDWENWLLSCLEPGEKEELVRLLGKVYSHLQ